MNKLATILTTNVLALVCHAGLAATFYVGPDGNDAWSGRLQRANPDRTDGPLASLAGSRDAVRRLKANVPLSDPVHVVVADGRYAIQGTLTFTPDDSGTENCPITYEAAPGAKPILSGGRVVTGWKEHRDGIWKAPSPVENTRQLYVDGRRAVRARGPAPAGLELRGNEGYRTRDLKVLSWRNIEDVEFCYLVVWSHSRCRIASIQPDPKDKTVAVIQMQQPTFAMARTKEGVRVALPDYVENAFELLDEAGEWYLDRPAKTIYYKPRPGEDRTKVQVIVPALETLIEVRGSVEHPVRNVTFQNLTFADATWLQPSRIGHADVQANFLNDPARPLKRDGVVTTIHNEQLKSPGNAVYRVPTPMNYNNRSQDRIKTCKEHDNFFHVQPPPQQVVEQAGISR